MRPNLYRRLFFENHKIGSHLRFCIDAYFGNIINFDPHFMIFVQTLVFEKLLKWGLKTTTFDFLYRRLFLLSPHFNPLFMFFVQTLFLVAPPFLAHFICFFQKICIDAYLLKTPSFYRKNCHFRDTKNGDLQFIFYGKEQQYDGILFFSCYFLFLVIFLVNLWC